MISQNTLTPLRLLIADGNDIYRKDLGETLERAGYSVVASSGNSARVVQVSRHLKPDLIILDGQLPGRDGLEIARILQQEKIAPVVLLTSFAEIGFIRRAAEAGIYSYLVKPFHDASLISAVEIARSQWETFRERERRVEWLKNQDETRAVVDCAKKLLMETCGYSEAKAYHFIQSRSMNSRRSMRVVAEAILLSHQILRQEDTGYPQEVARREEAA